MFAQSTELFQFIFFSGCISEVFNVVFLSRWFQIELARDMGYAAARFGHVMFPENVYEPALECAELLLEGVGKGLSPFLSFPIHF